MKYYKTKLYHTKMTLKKFKKEGNDDDGYEEPWSTASITHQ